LKTDTCVILILSFVAVKPSIDADEKVAATVNQSTTMTCKGEGYPLPTFEWFRDNTIIQSESRFTVNPTIQLSTTEARSSLSISSVVAGDFGGYVCIASNSNGQAYKTLHLTVKSKCVFISLTTILVIYRVNEVIFLYQRWKFVSPVLILTAL
jgi:hypothetical protein